MNYLCSLIIFVLVSYFYEILAKDSVENSENEQLYSHNIQSDQIKDADMMIEQSSNHTKQGLGKLFDKIDANRDLFVTKDELIKWIVQYNEEILMNEVKFELKRLDKNKDNFIVWEEFVKEHYGNLSLNSDESNTDQNEIIEFFEDDKYRFSIADFDKNKLLSINELKAFLRPHNHVEMLDYEVHRALVEYDKNKDKAIDRKEFIQTQYGSNKLNIQQKNYVNKIFDNYDKDHNGQLSETEMKVWLTPDINQFAETESQYLFNISDSNKDEKLSKDEILENFSHWVSSKATNFGADFRDEL